MNGNILLNIYNSVATFSREVSDGVLKVHLCRRFNDSKALRHKFRRALKLNGLQSVRPEARGYEPHL